MPYVQASSGLHGMMVRGLWATDCLSAEQLENGQIKSSSLKSWTRRLNLAARRIIVVLVWGFEVLSVDDGGALAREPCGEVSACGEAAEIRTTVGDLERS